MFGDVINAIFGGGGSESPSSPNRSAGVDRFERIPYGQNGFDSPSPDKWQTIGAKEPSMSSSGKLFSPEPLKPSATNTDPENDLAADPEPGDEATGKPPAAADDKDGIEAVPPAEGNSNSIVDFQEEEGLLADAYPKDDVGPPTPAKKDNVLVQEEFVGFGRDGAVQAPNGDVHPIEGLPGEEALLRQQAAAEASAAGKHSSVDGDEPNSSNEMVEEGAKAAPLSSDDAKEAQKEQETALRFRPGTTIFGLKAEWNDYLLSIEKEGIDACDIYIQISPRGPYLLCYRRQDGGSCVVEYLTESGYRPALMTAIQNIGKNIQIPGGGKAGGKANASPLVLMEDADGVRLAGGAFGGPDAVYNVLKCLCPDLVNTPYREIREDGVAIDCPDRGVLLRLRACDSSGNTTLEELMTSCQCAELPFEISPHSIEKVCPGIGQMSPKEKMGRLIELSLSNESIMLIVQYYSRSDFTSNHFVSLANGIIYDNDKETGGKVNAYEFAKHFMAGVKKCAVIIPRPPSKRKSKKRKLALAEEKAALRRKLST